MTARGRFVIYSAAAALFFAAALFCAALYCHRAARTEPESGRAGDNPAELRIGVIAPLSSEDYNGAEIGNAARLFESGVNRPGGIKAAGKTLPVRIILEDNRNRTEDTLIAARKLINLHKVSAIAGPYMSSDALPAARIAEEAGIPMVVTTATHPGITEGRKHVFRVSFDDNYQGAAVAAFVLGEPGGGRAAVLYDAAGDYSKNIAAVFMEEYQKRGGVLTARETYLSDEKNFDAQARRITESGCGVVFLPSMPREASLQITALRKAGFKGRITGSDAWYGELLLLNPDAEGCCFTSLGAPDKLNGRAESFMRKYDAKYGSGGVFTAMDYIMTTFDALSLITMAAERAGSAAPAEITAAIRNFGKYDAWGGELFFDGRPAPASGARVNIVKDKKAVFLKDCHP